MEPADGMSFQEENHLHSCWLRHGLHMKNTDKKKESYPNMGESQLWYHVLLIPNTLLELSKCIFSGRFFWGLFHTINRGPRRLGLLVYQLQIPSILACATGPSKSVAAGAFPRILISFWVAICFNGNMCIYI